MINVVVFRHDTNPQVGVPRLSHNVRDRILASFAVATTVLLAACGSPSVTADPSPTVVQALPSPVLPSPSQPPASVAPTTDTTGFAFAAEDVAAYYETQGFACGTPEPSATAAGFRVRTCEGTDGAGRTVVIGLVVDPDGGLANAFASVKGKDGETFLAPIDALDPLSGFLGAMLGEDRGSALLPWLASHLGDGYAETTSGPITVATYTASEDDHSTLYVEVANPAYLDAPTVR